MGVLPDYDRYVTNREAHFLLPLICVLAGAGMNWLRGHLPPATLLLAEISTGAATEPLAKMTEGQAAEAS